MTGMDILQPAVALMIWTMVMWAWMYATRIPAMTKAQVDVDKLVSDPDASLDRTLPAHVQWKAHNYNHLHEAPTVFYAVALSLALLEAGDGMTAFLAWIYTGLRIVHSIVQVTANKVMVRFVLFALSSLVLIALIAMAALIVLK
ncbi:MAPEG family protein [uncultured Erythrobacter sp.]|uniref:MAPEG family protein n=1 Tax=uncultured Erythrobacter sp. TaxID=263913 RepID=UPI00260818A9|nr:MAPEG family protein [uncultured Erythrobacter sp.]